MKGTKENNATDEPEETRAANESKATGQPRNLWIRGETRTCGTETRKTRHQEKMKHQGERPRRKDGTNKQKVKDEPTEASKTGTRRTTGEREPKEQEEEEGK